MKKLSLVVIGCLVIHGAVAILVGLAVGLWCVTGAVGVLIRELVDPAIVSPSLLVAAWLTWSRGTAAYLFGKSLFEVWKKTYPNEF